MPFSSDSSLNTTKTSKSYAAFNSTQLTNLQYCFGDAMHVNIIIIICNVVKSKTEKSNQMEENKAS